MKILIELVSAYFTNFSKWLLNKYAFALLFNKTNYMINKRG